jgi:hypothetical protein
MREEGTGMRRHVDEARNERCPKATEIRKEINYPPDPKELHAIVWEEEFNPPAFKYCMFCEEEFRYE